VRRFGTGIHRFHRSSFGLGIVAAVGRQIGFHICSGRLLLCLLFLCGGGIVCLGRELQVQRAVARLVRQIIEIVHLVNS